MLKTQALIDYINRIISLTDEEESILNSKISFRKYLKGQYLLQVNLNVFVLKLIHQHSTENQPWVVDVVEFECRQDGIRGATGDNDFGLFTAGSGNAPQKHIQCTDLRGKNAVLDAGRSRVTRFR